MSEFQSAEQYPMNFAELRKGQTITTDEIERITGVTRGSHRWPFAIMQLQSQIERGCMAVNNPILPRVRRDQIVMLHDAQADIELRRDHNAHVRGLRRALTRQLSIVDPSLLTADERARHDHNVAVQSRCVQAIRKAVKRQLKAEALNQIEAPASK